MDEKTVMCDNKERCDDHGCDHFAPHSETQDCAVICDEFNCACAPLPAPQTPQQQTVKNTAARGYRGDWTAEQFAARQVCKLAEELGELSASIATGSFKSSMDRLRAKYWIGKLETAGSFSRSVFDDAEIWDGLALLNSWGAKSELADIQVVVFNLAAALAEITGEPFDVVQAAVDKSAADVERGVR